MSHELLSQAGRFLLDDAGSFRIERAGRLVAQSGRVPIWATVYGMDITPTSIVVTERPQTLCVAYHTASPDVVLDLEVEATATGFRLLASAPAPLPVVGLGWALAPGVAWYGLGERVIQSWPLDALPLSMQSFMPTDHGADGALNIASPLLFAATGVALLLEEAAGEIGVSLNHHDDGLLRWTVRAADPPFDPDFDAPLQRQGPRLALDVLLADDIPSVHALLRQFIGHPTMAPPAELFSRPTWTTWARYKMAVDQPTVLAFADEIVAHGYERAVLEIDDRWQTAYGDLRFDPLKFPDPAALVSQLHDRGFRVTLWIPPFFDPKSASFREAAECGYLVRHPATGEPYLTRWWQGYGGLLDVSNEAALAWWRVGLQRLQTEYGVDGFKFDGGESNFVPPDAVLHHALPRRLYADLYATWVAQHFAYTEMRAAWRSQRHGILFRQWDKWSRWGLDNGLHSVLTQALALSMIGYPFILPDMIGGNAYNGETPDRELLIRWTQLTALLPAMQFSLPPWLYDDETDRICRHWTTIHAGLAPYLQTLVTQATTDGTPIVRPLFWHAPGDHTALHINDQFMLGDVLLVAPVVTPNTTSRDVYLPAGRWRDRWTGTDFEGGQWLRAYPAPLESMPVFERRPM